MGRGKCLRVGFVSVLLLAVCVGAPRSAVALSYYQVIDLGTLGGDRSIATAINSSNQVVGYSRTVVSGPHSQHAFLWDAVNLIQDLGTFGGHHSAASDINAIGQIACTALVDFESPSEHREAFLWEPGTTTHIGPTGEYVSMNARAVNASGDVVGPGLRSGADYHSGYLWSGGVTTDLIGLGSLNTLPEDMNDGGQIVGQSAGQAVRWEGGSVTPLGTLGGTSSHAYAINAWGQIVGVSHTGVGTTQHACLWQNGEMTDLGTLGYDSFGLGLNALGQAVGLSYFAPVTGPDPALFHAAFLWDSVNEMRNLNDLIPPGSGWVLRGAHDINDAGYIVGYGLFQGEERAFLLGPVATIPEPSTLLLLVMSLGAAMIHVKRRR